MAQSTPREGVLIYKADTIRRLEPHPAAYIIDKIVMYKKGERSRLEIHQVNYNCKSDTKTLIILCNTEGCYTFQQVSDKHLAGFSKFAIYKSHLDDQQDKAELALSGDLESYKVVESGQTSSHLGLPSTKQLVSSNLTGELIEVITTEAINFPINAHFPVTRQLVGTPLEFTFNDIGWQSRFTAIKLQTKAVSDAQFEIDPTYTIMSTEEMLKDLSDFK